MVNMALSVYSIVHLGLANRVLRPSPELVEEEWLAKTQNAHSEQRPAKTPPHISHDEVMKYSNLLPILLLAIFTFSRFSRAPWRMARDPAGGTDHVIAGIAIRL